MQLSRRDVLLGAGSSLLLGGAKSSLAQSGGIDTSQLTSSANSLVSDVFDRQLINPINMDWHTQNATNLFGTAAPYGDVIQTAVQTGLNTSQDPLYNPVAYLSQLGLPLDQRAVSCLIPINTGTVAPYLANVGWAQMDLCSAMSDCTMDLYGAQPVAFRQKRRLYLNERTAWLRHVLYKSGQQTYQIIEVTSASDHINHLFAGAAAAVGIAGLIVVAVPALVTAGVIVAGGAVALTLYGVALGFGVLGAAMFFDGFSQTYHETITMGGGGPVGGCLINVCSV